MQSTLWSENKWTVGHAHRCPFLVILSTLSSLVLFYDMHFLSILQSCYSSLSVDVYRRSKTKVKYRLTWALAVID